MNYCNLIRYVYVMGPYRRICNSCSERLCSKNMLADTLTLGFSFKDETFSVPQMCDFWFW
jgi:hypothetical protein